MSEGIIVALIVAGSSIIIGVINLIAVILNHKKLNEVHVLVNGNFANLKEELRIAVLTIGLVNEKLVNEKLVNEK